MDDITALVRQISQYPFRPVPGALDAVLLQAGGVPNGAYYWTNASAIGGYSSAGVAIPPDWDGMGALVASLTMPGSSSYIGFNMYTSLSGGKYLTAGPAARWMNAGGALTFSIAPVGLQGDVIPAFQDLFRIGWSGQLWVYEQITVGRNPANPMELVTVDYLLNHAVGAINGRSGANIVLNSEDINNALGLKDGEFVASNTFVSCAITTAIQDWYAMSPFVFSWNGRVGDVFMTADDVTIACTQPGSMARSNTPPFGDVSNRIATTAFVDDALATAIGGVQTFNGRSGNVSLTTADIISAGGAPINSPNFTGTPTGPTPAPGDNTGNLATTAFVQHAIVASTTGVASFNGRTGAVVLSTLDVTNAGGAPINAPAFTGNATAVTQAPGDNSTRVATTAFVEAALSAAPGGVSSFNTRTGAVTLIAADVTAVGGALLASPALTGTPTAPTATPTTNNNQLATTAFVANAIAAAGAPVTSFNGRSGAVTLLSADISAAGGALLASPIFTGTPDAPTAPPGNSSTQIATTAFVMAAVAAGTAGVTSYNGRTGPVTSQASDITTAGGALLASPVFTGTPAAPTATAGTNSTQLATTAFVQAALSAAPGGVSSFNTRTGAIVLNSADISAAGGAVLNSPVFVGTPSAPTQSPGTNNTNLATTAFVAAAIAAGGGVNTFNGRAGAVVLNALDIQNANGAVYRQSDSAPVGTGPNTLWFDSIGGQLYVQYLDPSTSARSWVIANSPLAPGTSVGPGGLLNVQVFTTVGASTYTPTTGMGRCVVECVGGGQGGDGVFQGAAGTIYMTAGGGSGGYSRKFLLAAQVGASQTVTVGAGGAGGAAGSNPGAAGGDTSFGTLCIAKGAPTRDANGRNNGAPATGGVGDIVVGGSAATVQSYTASGVGSNAPSGAGASGPWGGGGSAPVFAASVGQPAKGPGAGGGGACTYAASPAQAGGAGGAGIVIITEYA